MRHRSPARFLAPLALVLAALSVYLIVKSESDSGSPGPASTSVSTTEAPKKKKTAPAKKPSKTYTIKSGDTLSGIAEQTGVTTTDLLKRNPDVDANNLRVGEKLKLAG